MSTKNIIATLIIGLSLSFHVAAHAGPVYVLGEQAFSINANSGSSPLLSVPANATKALVGISGGSVYYRYAAVSGTGAAHKGVLYLAGQDVIEIDSIDAISTFRISGAAGVGSGLTVFATYLGEPL